MKGKTKNEQFLRNFGGLAANDLTNILNCDSEIDDNASTVIKVSNYHNIEDILNQEILHKPNLFKVLSFNSESLNSKFDEIKIFIENLKSNNVSFDAICINECWLDLFGEDLNIADYKAHPLARKVGMKGGLVTYVNENYKITELDLYTDLET